MGSHEGFWAVPAEEAVAAKIWLENMVCFFGPDDCDF